MVRFHLGDECGCRFILDFNLFIGNYRLLSVIEQKGGYTGYTSGLGVVCKLGKGQPFSPISLSVVHVDPQILLNLMIDSFGLSIRL